MDFILATSSVLMIIAILIIYVLNRVRRTDRLDELLKDLLLRQPSTVAFSLGYDATRERYKNAVIDSDGAVKIKYDANPVARDGSFIILREHGIVDYGKGNNGYVMSGMDTVRMYCPQGYEGRDCTLRALCQPSDVGTFKPLTYTQFNGLGLYRNDFEASANRGRQRRAAEKTHPRIRVHCLSTDGAYELQICPDAQLLDEHLQCQPYDLCTDRMTGFKHANPVSATDEPLGDAEYYVCENNRSVRRECAAGTVFSSALSMCVTRSPCYGRGTDTIPIDDNNYIQCGSDTGRKVHCDNGVMENEAGTLSCKVELCQPRVFSTRTEKLRYDYGETRCDANDQPIELFCDTSSVDSPYKISATWAVNEMIEPYTNWPKQILRENKCVPSTDDIVIDKDLITTLRWTTLMPNEHPFDLKTRQFVCATGDYRIDYESNTVVPALPNNRFVQTASPCHASNELLTIWQLPWRNYTPMIAYPRDKPVAVVGVGYDFEQLTSRANRLWPVKRSGDGVYCFARVYTSYDETNGYEYVIEDCEDSQPPVGFGDPSEKSFATSTGDRLLELLGFGQPASVQEATSNVWYTLATGKYDITRSRGEVVEGDSATLKIVSRESLSCPTTINLDNTTEIAEKLFSIGVMWTHLDDTWQQPVDSQFMISRNGITHHGKYELPGFYALNIGKLVDNSIYLTYRDIKAKTLQAHTINIVYSANVVVTDKSND